MTSFYVFIILFIFCPLINSQSIFNTTILNNTEITTRENEIDQASTSIISVFNTTINFSNTTVKFSETTTITSESTVSLNTISSNESTTSAINSNNPSKSSLRLHWWLLVALTMTVVIVIGIGFIHYYRRQTPYTRCIQCWKHCKVRFLQNWRSNYDDTDNNILQLEQPEIMNSQWPHRISFA